MTVWTRGFSLIELMVVVVIVAILGAIAYPSYQHYLLSSHRVEGQRLLLDAANRQENYFTDFGRYASSAAALNLSETSPSGYYHFVISAGTTTYSMSATASGAQGNDSDCVVLGIDQDGVRSSLKYGGSASSGCWE
ncbi:type IV pilin protein [Aeromonas dhakensis]|uniref:type IV pilin protein n=1 Tax=Aeromonas dhakensis TaxID=196024 RepID=UPI002157B554|nr:type IV pilin protein [Aeromonas dhakensis]MCR6740642.1 type IV pilin protein [Aeromonas dhakensis]